MAVPLAALVACAVLAGSAGADPNAPVLPAAGTFVIGDGNDAVGTPVTFWSASWQKVNSVSKGITPPAFKGYADIIGADPCQGPFTTLSGNSSKPPAPPLPPLMLALITDSVSKDGSTVSGSVVGLAVIATNPDYDPGNQANPGHDGTGTVVAFIPCATF
jgi:hypothetical protein